MLFDIRCSYDFNRFETPLEKLDILMPLDSVVWPADIP
jgi:hypothetical protein